MCRSGWNEHSLALCKFELVGPTNLTVRFKRKAELMRHMAVRPIITRAGIQQGPAHAERHLSYPGGQPLS